MTVVLNAELRNEEVDTWGDDLNSGFIDIYTGSQPADPDDSPTGTLLVSIDLAADAYDAAADGEALIPASVNGTAVATGTAGYAQQRNAANTRWMYGSVTANGGGGDVQISSTTITISDVITITSSTITQPAS